MLRGEMLQKCRCRHHPHHLKVFQQNQKVGISSIDMKMGRNFQQPREKPKTPMTVRPARAVFSAGLAQMTGLDCYESRVSICATQSERAGNRKGKLPSCNKE